MHIKHKLFIMWPAAGGAIILALYPAAAKMAVGIDVFNLVFFAVLLSTPYKGQHWALSPRVGSLRPVRPKPLFVWSS